MNKSFNEIYTELQARFGWNNEWEFTKIESENYPFTDDIVNIDLNKECFNLIISNSNENWYISNKNGIIYNNDIWALRKLKKTPEKWIVEYDVNNPLWEIYENYYLNPKTEKYCKYFHWFKTSNSISDFINYQYITLEQWYSFFHYIYKNTPCFF